MGDKIGFWSYARMDDHAEGGRIAQLSRDIAVQYTMITGEQVELWLDVDHLTWGARWRSAIDDVLGRVMFFIPVITPRYLQRAQCRRELNLFARGGARLGFSGLILPIRYQEPVAGDGVRDPALTLLDSFQQKDWTVLRFESRSSSEYRRAVHDLARDLGDAPGRRSPVASQSIDQLITTTVSGVAEFAERMAAISELVAEGAPSGAAALEAECGQLVAVAHTLNGDLYEIEAVRATSRAGTVATDRMGPVLENAFAESRRLADRIDRLDMTNTSLQPAFRQLRLALLLAHDCREVVAQWGGGGR